MKVSEWLRRYQISGQPPLDEANPEVAFWAGWLVGRSATAQKLSISDPSSIAAAIKAAEFIEERAK